MPTIRWRELPPIPKPLGDALHELYEQRNKAFPTDYVSFQDFFIQLLVEAVRAVRESYERNEMISDVDKLRDQLEWES